MSTQPAWRPEVIPGGGFDPRGLADSLWEAGNYDAANEVGRMVPDIAGRTCGLTGTQAHGYARIPGTNVPISHGAYEKTPTPLQRWTGGWIDMHSRDGDERGVQRDPERPVLKVSRRDKYLLLPLARTDGGPAQGGEALIGALDLTEGALVEMDYTPDGDVLLRRPRPAGPHPVTD